MFHFTIRNAEAEEADELTELALRAKASWGYSADFMEACRAELAITPSKIATWIIWVAEQRGSIRGMIALDHDNPSSEAQVEEFFVDPSFQGRGIGGALMSQLLEECVVRGVRVLGVDSDPNAEAIYHRFGFRTVGQSPSGSVPGRMLPKMELRLT